MAMNRTGVSSGQEAPKTASLSLTHCSAEGSALLCFSLNKFTDSSMFNDMDQTRCPMLLYFLLYGCTWKKKNTVSVLAQDTTDTLVCYPSLGC